MIRCGKQAGCYETSLAKTITFFSVYPDVHVMMLIGFGFLMTFLQRHGFGSIGFNFLLTCYVIEWSTLVNGWFRMIDTNEYKILLNVKRCDKLLQANEVRLLSCGHWQGSGRTGSLSETFFLFLQFAQASHLIKLRCALVIV